MADQGRLHLRLFLEGIEVNVIDATVSATAGAPASADIQVVYTPMVRKLLPRTLVHLFFYDNDKTNPQYRMLFCGDLEAITVAKSEGSRNVTLSCTDHRGYYQSAYVFFTNSEQFNSTGATEALIKNKALFTNANTSTFVGNGASISSLISDVFSNPKPKYLGFSHLDGALGGIIKSIETFTGILRSSGGAVNSFYAYNAARLQLLGQIGMYPNDYTSKKILSAESIKVLLEQRGQQLGDLVSLNELIDFILGFIYHRSVPNPCAPYFPPVVYQGEKSVDGDQKVKEAAQECVRILDLLIVDISTKDIGPSPITELVGNARGGLSVIMYSADFISAGSGTPYLPVDPLITEVATLSATSAKVAEYAKSTKIESPVHNLLRTISEATDQAITQKVCSMVRSLVAASEMLYPFDDRDEQVPASLNFEEVRALVAKAREQAQAVSDGFKVVYDSSTSARLYTTYMVPDLFFGVAPRCNVLFPDQYFTLSYSRNINAEVTRLQLDLKDDLTQATEVFQKAYYAPATKEIESVQGKALSDADAILANKLLDHELCPGIVPAFTSIQISALNAAFPKIDQDELYTSIANYRFLQKRLQQRRLNVSGTFNPYAAVGFPMVVVDSVDASDNQYIGLLTSLTHSLTQQGGNTSYQLEYARPHTADDDPYIESFGNTKHTISEEKSVKLDTYEIAGRIFNKIFKGEDYTDEVALIRFIAKNSVLVGEGNDNVIEVKESSKQTGMGYKLRGDGTKAPYQEYKGSKELAQLNPDPDSSILSIDRVDVTSVGALPVSELSFNIPADDEVLNRDFRMNTMHDLLPYLILTRTEEGNRKLATAVATFYTRRIRIMEAGLKATKVGGVAELNSFSNLNLKAVKYATGLKRELEAFASVPLTTQQSKSIELVGYKLINKLQSLPIDLFTDDEVAVAVAGSIMSGHRCIFNLYTGLEVFYRVDTTSAISVPIEEALRPLFIHGAFSSPKIGDEVYTPLLGVKSIVDDLPSRVPLQEVKVTIDGDTGSVTEYVKAASQQDAIDSIVTDYANSPYSPEFAANFVKRPIATINQVLNDDVAGFHYKAYADSTNIDKKEIPLLGNAFEIADGQPIPEGQKEIGLAEQERLKQEKVDDRVDVRVARAEAVQLYVNSLQSRGLRG